VSKLDPLRLALNSGEEYELLFTASPEARQSVANLSATVGVEITAIGEIVAGRGLQLVREGSLESILPAGYEHLI
jgi:thiamine-monophosphate kinase